MYVHSYGGFLGVLPSLAAFATTVAVVSTIAVALAFTLALALASHSSRVHHPFVAAAADLTRTVESPQA